MEEAPIFVTVYFNDTEDDSFGKPSSASDIGTPQAWWNV